MAPRHVIILIALILALTAGYWWGRGGERIPPAQHDASTMDDGPGRAQARDQVLDGGPRPALVDAGEWPHADVPGVVLPEADAPVMEYFDELAALARRGNARAACRLGVELHRCRQWQRQRAVGEMFERSLQEGNITGGIDQAIDSVARMQERNEHEARVCRGLEAEQLNQAISFQRIAAMRGSTRMRLWYAARPAMERERFLAELGEWERYRQLAPGYLEEALHAGDPLAPEILADVHRPDSGPPIPVLVPYRAPDPYRYYLYRELAGLLGQASPPSMLDGFVPEHGPDLDMERIRAEARVMHERLFASASTGRDEPKTIHALRAGGDLRHDEVCGD